MLLGACASSAPTGDPVGDRFREANRSFSLGRYGEAIPLYESVIGARERLKEAYHRLAYCYEVRGQESRAVETLEKVLRVDRQDEYALRHLWRLYCHRGFPEQALAMASGLAELYPADRGLKEEIVRLKELKGR